MNIKLKNKNSLLAFAIFLLIVVVGTIFCYTYSLWVPRKTEAIAVFLTNGQVYFGEKKKETRQAVMLKNVHYFQADTAAQESLINAAGTPNPGAPQLSLIRLGKEVHGPTDTMVINKEHIVFVEFLRDDSQVFSLIGKKK